MTNLLLGEFLRTGKQSIAIEILQKCREEKTYQVGLELGRLFLKIFPDNPVILLNLSKIAMDEGDYALTYDVLTRLKKMNIPENLVSLIYNTDCKCIPYIKDRFVGYNPEIVQKIVNRPANPFPMITLTITTCKRYDLFEQTINSFLNCCLDVDKIDKWLCVDDNSSPEDRQKMQEKYPFFEFYFKSFQEKGHPQSMNIIRQKVTTPYMFHMEDDWKFICQRNYLTDCMNVLGENEKLGQCLINKNYTETEKDINVVGGIVHRTNAGTRYYIHHYCKNQQEYDSFYKTYGVGPNSAYWRHFSFRPSLLRKFILDQLGPFDEKISHFESEYSERYYNAGYISAFLDSIYSLHIGRLTSERFDDSKANAYVLNGEKQLGGKEEALAKNSVGLNIKSYVVNLDRRPDRWESFQSLEEPRFLDCKRFSAVDGKKLKPNKQLQRIFEGNDYIMRQGMVGCAMSHIKLWVELVNNSTAEAFCVFEDDITFVPNFKEKFLHMYTNLPADWDLCYLGHHVWKKYKTDEYFDKEAMPITEKWDVKKSLEYSMGGTGGYIVSKKGAKGLLEFINKTGMTNGIDTVQQKAADTINVYYCKPHLIYADCWTPESDPDTDIQHNFVSLDLGETVDRAEYPERLLKNGVFNVDDALSFKPETYLVSCSETTHTSEAIAQVRDQKISFPFDMIDKGTMDDFATMIKDFFRYKDINASQFIADFIMTDKFTFPHENRSELANIYFEKFKNLEKVIMGQNNVILLHVSRWKKTNVKVFEDLLEFLQKINPNVSIVTVNGVSKDSRVSEKYKNSLHVKYLDFPENFANDSWEDFDKILYDQRTFRVEIIGMVKRLVRELQI